MRMLIIFLLCLSVAGYGQSSFGIKAGANISNMTFSGSGNTFSNAKEFLKNQISWGAGFVWDITISDDFSLQPQLLFNNKGTHFKGSSVVHVDGRGDVVSTFDYRIKMQYLELPLPFLYHFSCGKGRLFGGLGPYFAYGLGGSFESTDVKFDGRNKPMSFGQDLHLKPFDAGGVILLGYEWKNGLFISTNYSLGLVNIDPNTNAVTKNRYGSVGVGYILR